MDKLKGVQRAMGGVFPGVHRTTLASGKAAGVVGPSAEPREGDAVWPLPIFLTKNYIVYKHVHNI